MQFIEMKNKYDIIQLNREEVEASLHLLGFVANNDWEDLPEPHAACFWEKKDAVMFYPQFQNILKQMDSGNPELVTYPPEPYDYHSKTWQQALVLQADKDNVKIAINDTGFFSMMFGQFYYHYYDKYPHKDKIPSFDMIAKMEKKWYEIVRKTEEYEKSQVVR